MVRILITNAYSWYNKGDAGILIGMFFSLRKYIPNASISIMSRTPQIDSVKYSKYGIGVLRDFVILTSNKQRKILKELHLLIIMFISAIWLSINKRQKKEIKLPLIDADMYKTLRWYRDADIVISCGGGFLHDSAGYTFLIHLYSIFLALLLNKPTVLYAQSIGPFKNKLYKWITKSILNKVSLITVREKISYKYLLEMGINKPRIILTADSAFVINSISENKAKQLLLEEGIILNDSPLIGVTVRHWVFPRSKNIDRKHIEFVRKMTEIINYLIERKSATIIFLPQAINPYDIKSDDRNVAIQIFHRTKYKRNVNVLEKDFSPEELKGISGLMDIFIGTRMHSNIFAASMGTPVIAIEYLPKTRGIMSMLGLDEYVQDITDIDIDSIILNIEKAFKNKEVIREKLIRITKEVEQLALYNGKLIADLINDTSINANRLRFN
ncbi:MAG: polysaccharide pyruvyl transferase family protein [Candidatus Hodarchaeota archaeon]